MSGKGRRSWREEAPRSEGRQDRRLEGGTWSVCTVSTLTGGGGWGVDQKGWVKRLNWGACPKF